MKLVLDVDWEPIIRCTGGCGREEEKKPQLVEYIKYHPSPGWKVTGWINPQWTEIPGIGYFCSDCIAGIKNQFSKR